MNISVAARCGVLTSDHSTMTRTPPNAKRAKISVYKPKAKKRKADTSSGSMVVLKPKKTRRGKTIYTEVDATSSYAPSDEEGKSPKRKPSKTPSHSKTALPAPLEDAFQWEGADLNDQESHVPRITKVRLIL